MCAVIFIVKRKYLFSRRREGEERKTELSEKQSNELAGFLRFREIFDMRKKEEENSKGFNFQCGTF